MAIKINIQTQRSVPKVDDTGLALVILQHAVPTNISRGETVKIDAYDLTSLYAEFTDPGAPTNGDHYVDVTDELLFTAADGAWDDGVAIDSVTALAPTGTPEIGDTHFNTATKLLSIAVAVDWTAPTEETVETEEPGIAAAKELYALEYLISVGVSVLAYPVTTIGTFAAGDVTAVNDIKVLRYKFIVVPYDFVEDGSETRFDLLTAMVAVVGLDAQLFLDCDPDVTTATIPTLSDLSPKIELCINSGFIDLATGFESTLDISSSSNNFKGITSALATVVRKVKLLEAGLPWLPVAGETHGKVAEFLSLYRNLTTIQKEAFQAGGLNVLISRVGIGPLFVSQNTQYDGTGTLVRSHAVTTALMIKRYLLEVAQATEFSPNSQKTWTSLRIKLAKYLQDLQDQDGIKSFAPVAVGLGITMTQEDVDSGIIKVAINFLPVGVVEEIIFNVTIRETDSVYDVQTSGGVL